MEDSSNNYTGISLFFGSVSEIVQYNPTHETIIFNHSNYSYAVVLACDLMKFKLLSSTFMLLTLFNIMLFKVFHYFRLPKMKC